MSTTVQSAAPAARFYTPRAMMTFWLASGAVLALIGLFAPDGLTIAVFLGVPLVVVSMAMCRYLDPDGSAGAVATLLLAVTLRWLVAAFVHLVIYRNSPGLFAPDELAYEENSMTLLEYMRGHIPDPWPESMPLAITWSMCGIYSVVGHLPFVPKLVNGVLGGWTAVLTALMARRLFSAAAARRAGLIAAVAPSLVLWASLNTKDTATLLGAEVSLLVFMHLREKPRPWTFALWVAALVGIAINRAYEVLFVALPVLGSLIVMRGRHRLRNLILFGFFAFAAAAIAQQTGALAALGGGDDNQSTLERVNSLREGYAQGAGSAMNLSLVDTSTPGGLLLWMPIGLIYFFLAPIPFTGTSIISVATSPEMLIWYSLLPALWRGTRLALRERAREVSVLLIYAAFSSIGWAMVITNVGTVYRYRAQMLFVLIILIAAAQIRRAEEKRQRRQQAAADLRAMVDAARV